MSSWFAFLWLISAVCFIVALIRPTAFTRITKKEHSRKHLLGFFFAVGTVLFIATGATAAPSPTKPAPAKQEEQKKPEITTKTVTETQAVPFESKTVDDSSLAKGSTKITQEGKDGVKTLTYTITYTDGKQTDKKLVSEKVTTEPITKVTANGTYVAPAPAPAPTTNSADSGATARCNDGTLSYSAHASGTCSHHGGVSYWINHP